MTGDAPWPTGDPGATDVAVIGGGDITRKLILPALRRRGRTPDRITVLDVRAVEDLGPSATVLSPLSEAQIVEWIDRRRCPSIIATPTGAHVPYVRALAAGGVPFAVEKPLCATPRELDDLTATGHPLGRGFALGLYALEMGLPLTYLHTRLAAFRRFLDTPGGPLPPEDELARRTASLGTLRRGEVRLLEDACFSPAGDPRWTEVPAVLATFSDLCIHPFHLLAVVLGPEAVVSFPRIALGAHGPRADEVRRRSGGRHRSIAPTYADLELRSGAATIRIAVAKFAAEGAAERSVALAYDNGHIVCDLDRRSVGLFVAGERPLFVRVKPELVPYEIQLDLFEHMVAAGWPGGRTDALAHQIAALRWWFQLCAQAARLEVVRLESPVRPVVGEAHDDGDRARLAAAFAGPEADGGSGR